MRRIIGAACVLILGGCSAVVPAYNNAPFAIHWWLDSYADFDATQSTRVKADLAQLHAWHRKEDLPRIAQMLQTVQAAAPGDLRAEQICAWYGEGFDYVRGFGQRSAPLLAATVPTLKPAQVERVRRELAKSAKTWRGKWLDLRPAEQIDARLDKALDNVKSWYGSASPAQTALLRSQLESTPYDTALSWKELQRRHADIVETWYRQIRSTGSIWSASWWRTARTSRLSMPAPAPASAATWPTNWRPTGVICKSWRRKRLSGYGGWGRFSTLRARDIGHRPGFAEVGEDRVQRHIVRLR